MGFAVLNGCIVYYVYMPHYIFTRKYWLLTVAYHHDMLAICAQLWIGSLYFHSLTLVIIRFMIYINSVMLNKYYNRQHDWCMNFMVSFVRKTIEIYITFVNKCVNCCMSLICSDNGYILNSFIKTRIYTVERHVL